MPEDNDSANYVRVGDPESLPEGVTTISADADSTIYIDNKGNHYVVKRITPKPPAPEPMEVTTGSDVPVGALFGIIVIIYVLGMIALEVLGKF